MTKRIIAWGCKDNTKEKKKSILVTEEVYKELKEIKVQNRKDFPELNITLGDVVWSLLQ